MPNWVLHNGAVVAADELKLSLDNRSFKYGDGFFESLRMFAGRIPYWPQHAQRIQHAQEILGLQLKPTPEELEQQLIALAEKTGFTNARFRLIVYREGSGAYGPAETETHYLCEVLPLDSDTFQLNETGLTVGLYTEEKKYPGKLAGIKTTSSLLYVQASRYVKQQGWDDGLIVNTNNQIIEGTSSSLFLVKGGNLHTAPLKLGPVDGVMRKVILQQAMDSGFHVSAGPITEDMLLNADELWLTNAIKGIQWIGQYKNKTYGNKQAEKMIKQLGNVLINN